jgi:Arc/MetJ-type ribon-helix-helix transcriptional regulator
MARLVISVSDELLARVDALVAKGVFESRSDAAREALLSIVDVDEATVAMIADEPW